MSPISPQLYPVLFGGRRGDIVDVDLTMPPTRFLEYFDFTRGSNATQINEVGPIEWANANLVLRSSTLNVSPWSATETTVAASGGPGEYSMLETTANNNHCIQETVSGTANTRVYEMQVCVKGGLGRNFAFLVAGTTGVAIAVNLSTGAVSTALGSPTTAYSEAQEVAGDGFTWWKVGFHWGATSSSELLFVFASTDGVYGNKSYAGDITKGINIRNPMMCIYESQRTPAPYNQTGATAYYAPRYDYDPVTHAPLGLLVEDQRTNLLLGALYSGADLGATQNVTVTAVPHTLSFYGTGTVTLSGVSTAGPLVGAGAFPTRSTLTFTPTAGTLTVAATADVKWAQLEIGSDATSVIPTTNLATATRLADLPLIGTKFFAIFNQSEGAFVVDCQARAKTSFGILQTGTATLGALAGAVQSYNGTTTIATSNTFAANAAFKAAFTYTLANKAVCLDGGSVAANPSYPFIPPTPPSFVYLGTDVGTGQGAINGTIKRFRYYRVNLAHSQLVALTSP